VAPLVIETSHNLNFPLVGYMLAGGLEDTLKFLSKDNTSVVLIVSAMSVLPAVSFGQTDEIQVYDAVIAEPGIFNLTWHNNFIADGLNTPAFPGGLIPDKSFNGVTEWPTVLPLGLRRAFTFRCTASRKTAARRLTEARSACSSSGLMRPITSFFSAQTLSSATTPALAAVPFHFGDSPDHWLALAPGGHYRESHSR